MSKFAILSIVGVMALSLFLASSPSTDVLVESQFHAFVGQFGVNYASVEEQEFRFNVFKKNMEKIPQLEKENPHATFGITQFSDRTEEEFVSTLNEFSEENGYGDYSEKYTQTSDKVTESVDLRNHFKEIQDQGGCGSCWAFAATATFEAYKNINGETVPKLSEQELTDCVKTCSGCGGGLANLAYDWLVSNSFCTEASYKYEQRQSSCKSSSCEAVSTDSGSGLITVGEPGILHRLQNVGPISISIDASNWNSYTGGVLSTCGTSTNHAVVVTAFAPKTADLPAHWIIRNSWGPGYGHEGHIYLIHGENICNIEKRPSYPLF
mmetsp:Transcript_10635/g.9360  ORF Transcript_10635/g.9360 Transcript_10635/m.9360 type:complete len:323 (+) Transcript_10635:16-984(+)